MPRGRRDQTFDTENLQGARAAYSRPMTEFIGRRNVTLFSERVESKRTLKQNQNSPELRDTSAQTIPRNQLVDRSPSPQWPMA
jgi:hypothetical protein